MRSLEENEETVRYINNYDPSQNTSHFREVVKLSDSIRDISDYNGHYLKYMIQSRDNYENHKR